MNLSDLVHRTAGDNKVLATASNFETSANAMIPTPPPPPSSQTPFEHTPELKVDPSSFQRQQQEAYLFPMQAAANWTSQAFLQQHKEASRIPNEQKTLILDNNPYRQNPFTFTNNNAINKPTTQKIAPAPPPPSFSNNSNHSNHTTINSVNNVNNKNSNNTSINSNNSSNSSSGSNNNNINSNNNNNINNSSNNNNNNNNSINNSNSSSSSNNSNSNNSSNNTVQEVKVFHQQPIAPYPRNVFQIYGQQPTHYHVTGNNGLVPIAPLQATKEPKKPTVVITGDNVDANNLEEGYIQFVLRHDAHYIGDGIESLMYAKRKFSSVPKTGDLSYTTWDIFQLVQKLYTQEIRNWSQLVGQLGLADMAGRPQFAQRVKRWMHKYKIDCYFDYLLGNEYNFNSPDEKYSGCLMMGNYQKRKSENGKRAADETDSVKSDDESGRRPRKRFSDDEEGADADDSDDTHRIPILLAGSRKRMRDTSQNSLQMIENARQFMRTSNQSEDEEDNEEDDEEMGEQDLDKDGDEDEDDIDDEEDEDEDDSGMTKNKDISIQSGNTDTEEEDEEEVEDETTGRSNLNVTIDSSMVDPAEADEEDELASTCSSPSSPLLDLNSNMHIPLDDTTFSLSPSSHHSNTDDQSFQDISSDKNNTTSCSNCNGYTMDNMKSELSRLKSYISTLESKLEQQTKLNESNSKQIDKLLEEKQKLRTSTEKWKRKLIEDLVRGPKILSDDDDDMA